MLATTTGNTNTQLIRRCRQGDAQAWQRLIQQYGRLVHSIPVRYGLSPTEVDDVGQEVFLALAQGLDQIEDPEGLPAWLITTARRHSWRALQKHKHEQPLLGAELTDIELSAGEHRLATVERPRPFGSSVPSMEELLEGWQYQEFLAQGMAKLGGRCRELLTMIFLDPSEPSYELISEKLNIPKGSIGPTRNRCLQKLRQILEGLDCVPDEL